MKATKDHFSNQAATYAAFRPVYPQALYDFLFSHVPGFDSAWDCGTGSGQVAQQLANRFSKVYATDISQSQMDHAPGNTNVIYGVSRAEQTSFPDATFDLITIGTALHWFDFDAFYKEVKRVGKPGATIAAWAYTTCRSNVATDTIVDHFYKDVVGAYWDPERRYVDDQYRTIPFPFVEIKTPELKIKVDWTTEQFIGYLRSWSSVQHYMNDNGKDPVLLIEDQLKETWGREQRKRFEFPLFIRAGII